MQYLCDFVHKKTVLTSNAGVELAYVPYALIYFKSFIKVGGAKNDLVIYILNLVFFSVRVGFHKGTFVKEYIYNNTSSRFGYLFFVTLSRVFIDQHLNTI